MFKNIINKIKGRFGLMKPIPYYENEVLQYVTILDLEGKFFKLMNCSLHEFENKLTIYDDVSYLINVVKDGKSGMIALPNYERFMKNEFLNFVKDNPLFEYIKEDEETTREIFKGNRELTIERIKGGL